MAARMADRIVIRGAREHNLKNLDVTLPRDQARRHHRALGVGEVVARVRHHLRRGTAALRRVAFGLRAAVPRADAEARRRLDRRALAGDLDRAEDDVAQSAVDGRHRHRDLRLPPPPATRGSGHPALPPAAASRFESQTVQQIVDRVMSWPEGMRLSVRSRRFVRDRKGEYRKELQDLRKAGLRASCASTASSATSARTSSSRRRFKHTIEVVVDRLVVKAGSRSASPTRSTPRSSGPMVSVAIESQATATAPLEQRRLLATARVPRLRRLLTRSSRRGCSPSTAPRRLSHLQRARRRTGLRSGRGSSRTRASRSTRCDRRAARVDARGVCRHSA